MIYNLGMQMVKGADRFIETHLRTSVTLKPRAFVPWRKTIL